MAENSVGSLHWSAIGGRGVGYRWRHARLGGLEGARQGARALDRVELHRTPNIAISLEAYQMEP